MQRFVRLIAQTWHPSAGNTTAWGVIENKKQYELVDMSMGTS